MESLQWWLDEGEGSAEQRRASKGHLPLEVEFHLESSRSIPLKVGQPAVAADLHGSWTAFL